MKASTAYTPSETPASGSGNSRSRLQLWLKKLPQHKIETNSTIARLIRQEILDMESTSERLASLIQQDPPLALKLLQEAQERMTSREGDIQGLVHLISLLGVNHVSRCLSTQPTPLSRPVKTLIAASLFSAHLAKQLMPLKHGTVGERFFLPSLLFNAPLWLIWQAAPKLMQYIETQAQNGQPLKALCEDKLGFPLSDLLQQSPKLLTLPNLTEKALAIDLAPNLRLWASLLRLPLPQVQFWLDKQKAAKRTFYSMETGIYLINQYVLSIYYDKQTKHVQRWQTLLSRHLNIQVADIRSIADETAAGIDVPKYLSGSLAPHHRMQGLHKEPADKPQAQPRPASTLQGLREADDLHQVLPLAAQLIQEILNPAHCLILQVDRETRENLATFSHEGFDNATIQNLKLNINNCGECLNKVLQNPTLLSINQDLLPKIKPQLPDTLRAYWKLQPFGLMSLFYQGMPYAIIMCDAEQWPSESHQRFKLIGKEISKVLKRLS